MNVLSKNNINLNWLRIYVGMKNNWITLKDVFQYAENTLTKSPKIENEIVNLMTSEMDNYSEVLKHVENILLKEYNKNILIDIDKLNEIEKIWHLGFLMEIKKENLSINEKLLKISELWASFNYPKSWEGFIFYMPVKKNEINVKQHNDKKLYNGFLLFIESEKERLTIKLVEICNDIK